LTITTISSTSFSVSWSTSWISVGTTSYTYYLNGTATTPSIDNGVASQSATFSGLTAGNRYSIYIKSTNGSAVSTWSITRPTDITGCILWMDAADTSTVTFNGSNYLSKWVDKSTNAYQFTCATPSAALTYTTVSATNTINEINMTGSQSVNQLRCTTCTITPNFSLIASGYCASPGWNRVLSSPNDTIIFGGNVSSDSVPHLGLGVGGWYILNVFTPSNSSLINTQCVYIGTHNASTRIENGYVNGIVLDATAAYSSGSTYTGNTDITICSGPQQQPIGKIGELLAYNSVLSTTNRQYIEGYLAWKYGTQSVLIAGHPYKSAPPSGLAVWNP